MRWMNIEELDSYSVEVRPMAIGMLLSTMVSHQTRTFFGFFVSDTLAFHHPDILDPSILSSS